MDNNTEATLVQLIVKELQCQSCSSKLSPPLFQCCFGHRECSECLKKSTKCPTCNDFRLIKRDHLLERLCFNTILKCSFSKEGCSFSDKATEVASHEHVCTFKVKQSIANNECDAEEDDTDTKQSSKSENEDCSSTNVEDLTKQIGAVGIDSPGELLEEVIAGELECPVCFSHILPPITECHNGHRICIGCYYRIKKCPICRGPKCRGVNEFLMQIFDKVNMRCKNSDNGCQIRLKGPSILDHEVSCAFDSKPCPLCPDVQCRWQGLPRDSVSHCKKNHSDMISFERESKWTLEEFTEYRRSHLSLIYVYGVLFRCCWQIDGQSRRFLVNHVADMCGKRYTFDLNIVLPKTDSSAIVPGGICSPVKDFSDPMVARSSVFLSSENITNVCDSDGKLSYVIKIYKYG